MKKLISGFLAIPLALVTSTSQARYMNPNTGRFQTMDTYEGEQEDPISLHKYLYCHDNPVNGVDASGHDFSLSGVLSTLGNFSFLAQISNPVAPRAKQAARRIAAPRPSSRVFWDAYPDYDLFDTGMVWDLIGGNVGSAYGPTSENSCAARVSFGLNYSGAPIPNTAQRLFNASKNFLDRTYKGRKGDGNNYIVSARQMDKYLNSTWGTPDHQPTTVTDLDKIIRGLRTGECAVFAAIGHSGLLRSGYNDPYVYNQLPIEVWNLSFP